MVETGCALYEGQVMHHRLQPVNHRFVYRVFSCLIDLDELPLINRLKLFSVNAFNLFSFYERDHGDGKGNLVAQVRRRLADCGYASAGHRVRLLCYPRILGYVFNPLSVYFCYNADQKLEVILYEVNNTFGSTHTYLLPVENEDKVVHQDCGKLLYVSPFMPMDAAYEFYIKPPGERVSLTINQTMQKQDDRQAMFNACFNGQRRPLRDGQLLRLFFKYPMMTLKIMGGIHWEALKLWRKKLPIQPGRPKSSRSISWQDNNGITHYESL